MHILALDRGTKKIGLARRSSETNITFPLGILSNNSETSADLIHIINQYTIDTIVYGKPHIPRLQQQLTEIITQITLSIPEIVVVSCDEAYTSVQADILLQQQHHPGQDAVAAMYILDTYLQTLPPSTT